MFVRGNYTVIDCDKGMVIDRFAEELLNYAAFHNEKVMGVFNGVYFEVKKGMTVRNVVAEWSKQRENY